MKTDLTMQKMIDRQSSSKEGPLYLTPDEFEDYLTMLTPPESDKFLHPEKYAKAIAHIKQALKDGEGVSFRGFAVKRAYNLRKEWSYPDGVDVL